MTLGSVAIVGTGQVGTMLGLALRASGVPSEIVLLDRDAARAEASLARGAGDRVVNDPVEALARDVVVLAMPIPEIVRTLDEHGTRLAPGGLVVDTGSAKAVVVDAMRRTVPAGVHAIGGHPLAGTERAGPEGADPVRLVGATFVLTPVREDAVAVDRGMALARACGALPLVVDAETHDRVLARTSHLPHLLAYALACVAADAGDDALVRALASSGFRDATRLAASDPEMVAGFVGANARELDTAVDELKIALDRLLVYAAEGHDALAQALSRARAARGPMA